MEYYRDSGLQQQMEEGELDIYLYDSRNASQ